MATANKVHFGVKGLHYALITYSSAGVPSWGSPVAVPGSVNITLSKESNNADFYADNMKYFRVAVNNGYTGSLEMADFPVAMRQALWNQTVTTTSKLLVEDVDAQPAEFALMFETDGDQGPDYWCFYRCIADRPDVNAATTNEATEVQTQTCDLTVLPVVDPSSGSKTNGKVWYRTTADTPSATLTSFYSSVNTTLT